MNSNKSVFFTALGVETIEILATIGARKKEEGETIIPPWIFKFTHTKFSFFLILIKVIHFILFK